MIDFCPNWSCVNKKAVGKGAMLEDEEFQGWNSKAQPLMQQLILTLFNIYTKFQVSWSGGQEIKPLMRHYLYIHTHPWESSRDYLTSGSAFPPLFPSPASPRDLAHLDSPTRKLIKHEDESWMETGPL